MKTLRILLMTILAICFVGLSTTTQASISQERLPAAVGSTQAPDAPTLEPIGPLALGHGIDLHPFEMSLPGEVIEDVLVPYQLQSTQARACQATNLSD